MKHVLLQETCAAHALPPVWGLGSPRWLPVYRRNAELRPATAPSSCSASVHAQLKVKPDRSLLVCLGAAVYYLDVLCEARHRQRHSTRLLSWACVLDKERRWRKCPALHAFRQRRNTQGVVVRAIATRRDHAECHRFLHFDNAKTRRGRSCDHDATRAGGHRFCIPTTPKHAEVVCAITTRRTHAQGHRSCDSTTSKRGFAFLHLF